MSRATLVLINDDVRRRAIEWCAKAPAGTCVEYRTPKRSQPQNSLMWSLLTQIASQIEWHGVKLKAADWKLIFVDALKRDLRAVPNLDGTGFVNLGVSSSDLSKQDMSRLIDLIMAFAAAHGVDLHPNENGGMPCHA